MELELRLLDDDEIGDAIERLPGWAIVDGKLHRQFVFADFVEAMGFMTRAAIWAEKRNHHPEWSNVYKTVVVDLQTHDVGGLSPFDVDLAEKMNELAGV
ncbi:MAG: 4a-hydroxytetrahydrobiopterin dehydratase [Ilumatobacter sp.]|uniref:4a-hydroxytetrahydrobiopterin dehydratase n=1 Tax=Ilumatobacter sp. TaxID=1967498 RepID=UPI00260E690D|nr:4a-hydroxytetrahydrobiopterin dehydratase [Ilumatobacter sp.]MDJ0771537.1 4a-hydroxytetrahydrobiopterin dehydratase [Ilumatobacter sp.]